MVPNVLIKIKTRIYATPAVKGLRGEIIIFCHCGAVYMTNHDTERQCTKILGP